MKIPFFYVQKGGLKNLRGKFLKHLISKALGIGMRHNEESVGCRETVKDGKESEESNREELLTKVEKTHKIYLIFYLSLAVTLINPLIIKWDPTHVFEH